MSIRVVVVEDHVLVGAALRSSLDAVHDLEVAAVAETFEAGVALARAAGADVAVVDLRIGEETALAHLGAFLDQAPGTRVLVLTGWATEQSLLEAIEGGASGYVTKDQPLDHLVDAIRRVHRGETVVAPDLVAGLVRRVANDRADGLTGREVQILEHLAAGHSTSKIADELFLSAHTVRNNIGNVLRKLGVHSRLEAVGEGIRRGLINPATPPSHSG